MPANFKSLIHFVVTTIALSLSVIASPQAMPQNTSTASSSISSDQAEIDAMKTELAQMRVILNQMSTNLAFVSDSQSPLKHQFQLDIEMWQVLMMQMQRRIDRLEATRSNSKPVKH